MKLWGSDIMFPEDEETKQYMISKSHIDEELGGGPQKKKCIYFCKDCTFKTHVMCVSLKSNLGK